MPVAIRPLWRLEVSVTLASVLAIFLRNWSWFLPLDLFEKKLTPNVHLILKQIEVARIFTCFRINKHWVKKINSKEVNIKNELFKIGIFGSSFYIGWALPWIHKIISTTKKPGRLLGWLFFRRIALEKLVIIGCSMRFFFQRGIFQWSIPSALDECLNEGVSLSFLCMREESWKKNRSVFGQE